MEHSYSSGCDSPPANALNIGYQHDSGEYYLAVANTEWGRIPGKAKDGNCWYSYDGNEHSTDDFDYVTHPNSMTTVQNDGCGPPPGARPIGYQNDGRGDQYAVLANTEWGRIPGKACDSSCCWYSYGGEEKECDDFEWLICTRVNDPCHERMDIDFIQACDPPENGLNFGYQNDGRGDQWIAVAETEWGKIPGKACGSSCWYGYNGQEYETDQFHYVVHTSPHKLVRNDNLGPPEGAIVTGNQNDGRGDQYAAIAISEWGRIPGKAEGNTCWYPYGGEEHETYDFEWVVFSNDQ